MAAGRFTCRTILTSALALLYLRAAAERHEREVQYFKRH